MMIEEVSLTDIQDFIVRTVAKSAVFAQFCTDTIGGQLKYYRGADLRYGPASEASFTAYKFYSRDEQALETAWHVQYVIGLPVDEDDKTVDEDGITILPSSDKVEALALTALGIIRQGVRDGGLKGRCDMYVADANVLITEVGEADDVQAIVTLRFEAYKTM